MHPNPRRIVPGIVLVALVALIAWYIWLRPANGGDGVLSASGTIEAVKVQISPELGGRVVAVYVEEGDAVKAGEVLVELDASLLEAQQAQAVAGLEVARANAAAAQANESAARSAQAAAEATLAAARSSLASAQANFDLLRTGATAEQLQAAEAQLTLAQANYQAAQASYAALTAGARPEEVAAVRLRLDLAWRAYFSLTVTLDGDQLEDVRAAVTQAETNLANAKDRQSEMASDANTPAAILDALPAILAEAQAAYEAAQAALEACEAKDTPFHRQLEAARRSQVLADLVLAQAQARRTALQGVDEITPAAEDALQAGVEEAQDLVSAARTAYEALAVSTQATRLRTAWNEVQSAQTALNSLARGGTVPLEAVLNQLDAAAAGEAAARASFLTIQNGARTEQLASAQALVDAAHANVQVAQAQVEAAAARADAAQAQTRAAQAQVDAAQAGLEVLRVQIARLTLTAPVDGVVMVRGIEPGELALPGGTLLTLGRYEQTITVYIPEDRYGEIAVGQRVVVTVDSFAGEEFQATVIFIAEEAEFTPRNVQTVEGRKNTVFAIRLKLEDTGGKLKPGMPADVVFK